MPDVLLPSLCGRLWCWLRGTTMDRHTPGALPPTLIYTSILLGYGLTDNSPPLDPAAISVGRSAVVVAGRRPLADCDVCMPDL